MKNGASTIKEAIILVLSNEFPLTAIQLHFKVARLLDRTFSYQAFYKCLQEFMEKNMINRNKGFYFLSESHIQNILAYSEQLKTLYGSEDRAKKLGNAETQLTKFPRDESKQVTPAMVSSMLIAKNVREAA
jgi:hypothetical protein